MTLKRKRILRSSQSGPSGVVAIYKPAPSYKRRRAGPFVPGRHRVGGNYGRWTGRGAEYKFIDFSLDDAVVAATSTITSTIHTIPAGYTESTRIGRKCTLTNIHWKYRCYLPETLAAANPIQCDAVRIILYQDKQCNGAAAVATDILETDNYQSFRNLANSGRFIIHLDKIVTVNHTGIGITAATTYSTTEVTRNGKFNKKLNIPLEFDGVNGTIGETKSNCLGVLLISNNGVAGFESNIRLRFSDQ